MRPFLDHDIQLLLDTMLSDLFRTRITLGDSVVGGFDTLQTLRSPSAVCVASMSDFCFEDEACHVRCAMGDGPWDVVKVCRIVNVGCRAASNIEPLRYLGKCVS